MPLLAQCLFDQCLFWRNAGFWQRLFLHAALLCMQQQGDPMHGHACLRRHVDHMLGNDVVSSLSNMAHSDMRHGAWQREWRRRAVFTWQASSSTVPAPMHVSWPTTAVRAMCTDFSLQAPPSQFLRKCRAQASQSSLATSRLLTTWEQVCSERREILNSCREHNGAPHL